MVRVIVTLEESDKLWLDRYSRQMGMPATDTVRQAIKEFRKKVRSANYERVLNATTGLLRGKGDSIRFVQKIRLETVEKKLIESPYRSS